MNRRQFLKGTGGAAAAAAFPAIITSDALGAPGVPPASERIRLGFIGVRNRGMQNVDPMLQHTAALCDVDRNVLAEAKAKVEKKLGRPVLTFSDYRQMLESPEIDAVVISTPDHWHALQTIHACEAGKDVYCEKPLSLTIDEGRRMVRAARRYGRVVQTGSQQRSDDKFRLAAELVRNGKLGKVSMIRVGLPGPNFKGPAVPDSRPPAGLNYEAWLGPAPYRPYNDLRVHYWFRFFWDYSGGQMTNWGAHHLDIVQWALGMDDSGPIAAEGTASYQKDGWYETPEKFHITYTYPNSVTVLCGQEMRGGITFEGERGSLWVNRGKIEANPKELLKETFSASDTRLYVSDDHYQNWLDCIKTRKTPICDVEIGHRSATVCHLGNLAIRSGERVEWNPKAERAGSARQRRMQDYDYRGGSWLE